MLRDPQYRRRLLDGHALRQIPRLIDIAAAAHRNVIREQLQRNHFEQRKQEFAAWPESR